MAVAASLMIGGVEAAYPATGAAGAAICLMTTGAGAAICQSWSGAGAALSLTVTVGTASAFQLRSGDVATGRNSGEAMCRAGRGGTATILMISQGAIKCV